MTKVFIDGSQGTTGLKIFDRLKRRSDIELIVLEESCRKEVAARKTALNAADVVFLCLPDEAAVQAVSLIENENTVVIDTSTAHRTNPDWLYGFPELLANPKGSFTNAKRIAVPGCYAGGFIALVKPLIEAGILSADSSLSCHAISGYSGAGKKGIAQYEKEDRNPLLSAPRLYALSQQHKHLKEMKTISGLSNEPIFVPYICDYYAGMVMTVPLFASHLENGKTVENIKDVYRNVYANGLVRYVEDMDENGFLSGNALAEMDNMEITVCGNEERILLIARYDNLGKGASGAALECMNYKMGQNPDYMLNVRWSKE